MPYEEPSKLSETGTAEFYNGEQFDLRSAALDIAPATDVIRQRNEQLLGAAADRVVDRAVSAYAQQGITEIETHISSYSENISKAGTVIQAVRAKAIEANKR